MPAVLIAGESWITHSVHVKGADSFTTSEYHEGVGPLRSALQAHGWSVDYLPNHAAGRDFPAAAADLQKYDVIVLSDIGANTLLLHPDTFVHSRSTPNRLQLLHEYVQQGGGLVMIGGYMTFSGIEGKGCWAGTPVEAVLPVRFQRTDDRVEAPQGVTPTATAAAMGSHPVLAGLGDPWPFFLGWNRATAAPGAQVLMEIGDGDPFVAVATAGQGRTAAFASDCAPHWGPPEFLNWAHYGRFWHQLLAWTAGQGER